ncbi:MAG: hypothetical protein A2X34_05855 [Elusimicrobia bacterium GWC2_51_8]|nr:MAG: hypothetical protein A2X33_03380 [Elusimicrobia bacterium GWA2_51_34]OGR58575.1 MAG: hypothetical protein A2X34_05855 [Elusimicrobia bacterium GWC2_51_8]OGR86040.1 MAG: hypothetical protein A2021_09890 [Elusimicrobia bacterium GWF2_52_66]
MAYNVLLVEDDPMYLAMVSEYLTSAGYHVRQAITAHDGLTSIKSEPPHLLILDLNLPDKSGSTLLLEIRKNPATKSLPIIIMTGTDTGTDHNYLLRMGADAFLSKSTPQEQCIVTIEALFRRLEMDGFFLRMGGTILDQRHKSLYVNGVRVENLSLEEFEFLALLMEYLPAHVTSKEIARLVWKHKGFDIHEIESSLKTKLSKHQAIEISGDLISGYSLQDISQ